MMKVSFRTWCGKVCLLAGVAAMWLTGCSAAGGSAAPGRVIKAVGAENEYADVIRQIGGKYVSVTAVINDPNVDPHSYEAGTREAALVAGASLVVQNGLGYDGFMDKLEAASPKAGRRVIVAARAAGFGPKTANPHLWYDPQTMPRVAAAVAHALKALKPDRAGYFAGRLAAFDKSMAPLNKDLAGLRQGYAGSPVAVTEPVADYLLSAAGLNIMTPWGFQLAVMNGTDPAPQAVQAQENLLRHRRVRILVYNRQAVDGVTTALLKLARANHIPVVGVYETMPPGLTYQTWMEKEVNALMKALQSGVSTETLS